MKDEVTIDAMAHEAHALGLVVAIDGPSGSGKSTIARKLATLLDGEYLDTGAMYRALAWYCMENDLIGDAEAVAGAADSFPLAISTDPNEFRVLVGATDVTDEIRSQAVTENVSTVSTNVSARERLVRRQQEIIATSEASGVPIVVEGRDITTVVAPQAPVRLLLTASQKARLNRRTKQLHDGESDEALEAQTRAQVVDRDAKDSTVVNFTSAAEGVATLDSSALSVDETMDSVLDLVIERIQELQAKRVAEDNRARAMRASLDAYELSDNDAAVLDGQAPADGQEQSHAGAPVLAVIGRPNVGKSTLVNRILGRRAAVVQDQPGVTRDRVSYPANWAGKDFTLVDTGGWDATVKGLDKEVALQAELAIEMADAVLFVVDASVGVADSDERLIRLLRRSGKPVVLAANKIDSEAQEADAAMLWSLGLGEPIAVSALHGRGSGDLLDRVVDVLPKESAVAPALPEGGPRRIALIGRPNVGKSSLLNQLAGAQRVVVHDMAGTTRDPVDELIEVDGRPWWVVDTAGVRRRLHRSTGADYYAALRTQAALEKAEVALVLLEASVELTEQDVRIVQQAVDAGRALVLVNNKWDKVDVDRQAQFKREVARDLHQVSWAPRVNISAATGWHTNRLVRAIDQSLLGWQTRISTGKLNSFLGELVAANPHPVRGGKQPRILFGTQVSSRPPRFVLFTTGFLDPGYRRFIERKLRELWGFPGTPIQISVRVREKRRK